MAIAVREEPGRRRDGYRCEQRRLFSQSSYRRSGFADMAKDNGNESGRALFEREIFLARDEKKEMGRFVGNLRTWSAWRYRE